MKKFNTEFGFVFAQLFKGVKGGQYLPLEAQDGRLIRRIKATINLPALPKSLDYVTLLDDTQIGTIFEEECGEMFDTLEDVRHAFTFEARRHRGWIDRSPEGPKYHPHLFWVALICDQGSKQVEEAAAQSSFILSQLVRFGVMDKLRLTPERKE